MAPNLEGCNASAAAFHVAVVDHDVSKYFGRIEQLVPSVTPVVLVGRPASVTILIGQDHIAGILQTLVADAIRQRNQSRNLQVRRNSLLRSLRANEAHPTLASLLTLCSDSTPLRPSEVQSVMGHLIR